MRRDPMFSPYIGGGDCRPMAWNPEDEPGIDPVLIEAKARELAEDGFCSVDANAAKWLASLTGTQAEARDTFMRASIIHYMSGDGYDQQRDALEPLREAFISAQWLAYLDAATDALETA